MFGRVVLGRVVLGRVVLGLALVFGAEAALAQDPACSLYKVTTPMLNISKDERGDSYIDVLRDGEIACVTRKQKVGDNDRGYVPHKLEASKAPVPVNGWATLRYMRELSATEAAAFAGGTPPAAAPPVTTPPPAAVVAPAVPPPAAAPPLTAPPPAAVAAPAAPPAAAPAAGASEDVMRFDQSIPFGPFPVNGHSIKDLINGVPLFSPIEGLDESLWKKTCSSCHKWNQARLCEQGASYAKAPRNVLRHPHPFGGAFKIALMRWAQAGCK